MALITPGVSLSQHNVRASLKIISRISGGKARKPFSETVVDDVVAVKRCALNCKGVKRLTRFGLVVFFDV
jgi:hypothetical protein